LYERERKNEGGRRPVLAQKKKREREGEKKKRSWVGGGVEKDTRNGVK